MYGPTGVGFLYGKREMLEALPPANFGGSMVELAWMDQEAQYMEPPARFEAGTQPVAQVVAAGVAAEWLMNIGMENLEAHERTITDELLKMGDIDGIRILGPRSNKERIGTVAFEVEGVHPHDVGQFIDAQGIAIRVGHHCAQPVHRHFGVYASNRASSGIYNSVEDAQALVEALGKDLGLSGKQPLLRGTCKAPCLVRPACRDAFRSACATSLPAPARRAHRTLRGRAASAFRRNGASPRRVCRCSRPSRSAV